MKIKLHHVNISSSNVPAMENFYRGVLGLGDEDPEELPPVDRSRGVVGEVAFVTDGAIQMHLSERDPLNTFKTGQAINPLVRGHIAFRTDDIEAFKKHLEAQDIPYSDWGGLAVTGWHQVFFFDPEGNVVEVHQVT
ncbi:MAG: VOC family protein [Pseudomonadota bacterium]